ncbi:MAG: PTS sugar transporter subunit IIA [Candidatus Cloacimonetes bacterium]|nr:PTS sugar transporter subunit IIA [Candidatus Cloacimonadota bacterium]
MWKKIIDKNLIVINPDVTTKRELFEGMVNHVYNHDYILNQKKFLKALNDREEMANTELMQGIALPHARSKVVEKLFMCIIIRKEGIEYDNSEMGKAKIIFFFGCSEEQNKEYLQLLAQANRLLRKPGFRKGLLEAGSVDEVAKVLEEFDDEEIETGEHKNHLMILTLNEHNEAADVMNAMVELGITNASIIDATSMARKLAYELPVFAGLSYMAQGKSKRSTIILAHIESRDLAYKLSQLLKENGIDLDKKGVGFIQIIEVADIIGNYEEDIEL